MPKNCHDPRPCNICGEKAALTALYRKWRFTVVRCDTCRLVYIGEYPSYADLEAVYSDSFFDLGEKFQVKTAGPMYANILERIAALMALPEIGTERWLDVGCATGGFIAAASDVAQTVDGVEFSSWAAGQARTLTDAHVQAGDFLDAAAVAGSYDVVTMWDYLEHVVDPMANLRKTFEVLKPGGYLSLSTGNVESLVARIAGRYWHLMTPPEHLFFFSPDTVTRALREAGFEIVSVRRPGKRVPLDFMMWKVALLFLPRASVAARRWGARLRLGKVAPRINFFDIMTVTARRPAARAEHAS